MQVAWGGDRLFEMGGRLNAIISQPVAVDADVSGLTWTVANLDALARLIAIVLLGQSQHAARIIAALEPEAPAFSDLDLIADAQAQMRIRGTTEDERKVSRFHRDGFLFECMSWIVAREGAGERTFLKDPHIDATSHGLDGLIVELHPTDPEITRTPHSTKPSLCILPRSRELVGTIIPRGLSFIAGVVARMAQELNLPEQQAELSENMLATLSGAARRGFDSVAKMDFANANRALTSRVAVHRAYQQSIDDLLAGLDDL